MRWDVTEVGTRIRLEIFLIESEPRKTMHITHNLNHIQKGAFREAKTLIKIKISVSVHMLGVHRRRCTLILAKYFDCFELLLLDNLLRHPILPPATDTENRFARGSLCLSPRRRWVLNLISHRHFNRSRSKKKKRFSPKKCRRGRRM